MSTHALPESTGPIADTPWRCVRCRSLLAYVDGSTGQAVRFKTKDIYIWVVMERGSVQTACRKCAAFNEIINRD